MDWANERYVRLFVRDTTTWKLLPWQSRALLPLILRKLDRAGVIDLGSDGVEGLAALVEVPLEFVQEALPPLLKREVFKMAGGKFVMPNFMAAQEAKQSDAQRKRESREKQRLAAIESQAVTGCHNLSESQAVTTCPQQSHDVTPDQTRTNPVPDQESPSARARDPGAGTMEHVAQRPTGNTLCRLFGRLRREILKLQSAPGTEYPPDANGKASSFADQMAPEAFADVEPTMRRFLEHLRDGDDGWNADPNNASLSFGAWRDRFHDLRIEIAGKAVPSPNRSHGRRQQSSWMPPEV